MEEFLTFHPLVDESKPAPSESEQELLIVGVGSAIGIGVQVVPKLIASELERLIYLFYNGTGFLSQEPVDELNSILRRQLPMVCLTVVKNNLEPMPKSLYQGSYPSRNIPADLEMQLLQHLDRFFTSHDPLFVSI